jgi:hypothetical protein
VAEAVLLGGLMGALIANPIDPFFYGVLGSILALPVVLFLHGYYLTRILAGSFVRGRRSWVYPSLAALLFAIHTHVVFVRLGSDMSLLGKANEFPFLVGGAYIVSGCAFAGNWLLVKWAHRNTDGPSIQRPDSVPLDEST